MTHRIVISAALIGSLALGGCSASGAPSRTDPSGTLSPAALGALTNYRAELTSGVGARHMRIRTQVHSARNWASESGLTVLHIGSMRYVQFAHRWIAHAERPGRYAQTNLPAFARQFYAMTRLNAAAVRRGPPCRQAGRAGHLWTVRAASGTSFGETARACIADRSGALLRLTVRTPAATEVYAITAVGDVPPFSVPARTSVD